MSLFITSLNSGSNGNCYYVGNEQEAVLIDAGISCREIEKRMHRLCLPVGRLKAVFISHEHSDHIRGLSVFARKHGLPVYITAPTLRRGGLQLETGLVRTFLPHQPVTIGDITVTAFPKYHDAADPYSFVASCGGVNVGIFTDLGRPCAELVRYFKVCHAAFLESNYDEAMLTNGRYPYHLKQRIRGGHGHLSNRQALELFLEHRPRHMSHLLLAHLSQNNNCPELVEKLFRAHAGGVQIVVASRHAESPLYHIRPQSLTLSQIDPGPAYVPSGQLQLDF